MNQQPQGHNFARQQKKKLTSIFTHECLHHLITLDIITGASLPASPRLAILPDSRTSSRAVRLVFDNFPGQPPPRLLGHGGIASADLVAEVDLLQTTMHCRPLLLTLARLRTHPRRRIRCRRFLCLSFLSCLVRGMSSSQLGFYVLLPSLVSLVQKAQLQMRMLGNLHMLVDKLAYQTCLWSKAPRHAELQRLGDLVFGNGDWLSECAVFWWCLGPELDPLQL